MTKRKAKGLSVREVLEKTVEGLERKFKPKEIIFLQQVAAEIADDSDYHRERIGYMYYKQSGLFRFDNQERIWAISLGTTPGNYPAANYDSDILALMIDSKGKKITQIKQELKERIQKSDYFENSLIRGMYDGNLAVKMDEPSSGLGKKMLEILRPEIGRFIAQETEYDREVLRLDNLKPMVKEERLYKPDFVGFMMETIEKVLGEN